MGNDNQDMVKAPNAPFYLLRPETVETMFVLFQLTGDEVYREWGWEIFTSIEQYCRTDIAYASIDDVGSNQPRQDDRMESFFLAETLKYLYLLMDPETEVDILEKFSNTKVKHHRSNEQCLLFAYHDMNGLAL
eukprot:scaffold54828_cov51-Attheya_sp.AAC.2